MPFLSNLSSYREVRCTRSSLCSNNSRFDTAADGAPFAQTARPTPPALGRLGLAPYLGYLPASLPLRLQSAVLGDRPEARV